MTVKVNHFGKMGKVQANETSAKSVKSTKSASGKEAEKPSVFKFLLNELRGKENNHQVGSLRNKPAYFGGQTRFPQDLEKPEVRPCLNTQNVNNLAASALIALTTLSSGPNRMSGICVAGGQSSLSSPAGFQTPVAFAPGTQEVISKLCQGQEIGALSSHFESGEQGPGVVGYDPNGGTSYGTYQISSRAGTMNHFIDYLSEQAPDLAGKLKAAGAANTGSASGRMPGVWKKIAAADPVRFSKLQFDFIEKSHYVPALQEISQRTGLDVSKAPRALQEVLWSTAVQHGPNGAAKIFTKAIGRAQAKNGGVKLDQLIGSVYDLRASQFGSSGGEVQVGCPAPLQRRRETRPCDALQPVPQLGRCEGIIRSGRKNLRLLQEKNSAFDRGIICREKTSHHKYADFKAFFPTPFLVSSLLIN